MRRRWFVAALLGSVCLRVTAAQGQQNTQVRRIGIMMVNAENDPEGATRILTFRRALRELGWMEQRNLSIDYHWAVDDQDRAQAATAALVSSRPEVVLANGTPALTALQRATRTMPIVFVAVTDPVGAGYVDSLAHPGNNTTGFSTFEPEIGGKWIELLKAAMPGLKRVAGVLDRGFGGFTRVWEAIERFGPQLGLQVEAINYRKTDDDLDVGLASFAQYPGGGLIIFPTAVNNASRNRIFSLALAHRLPAIYPFRHYAMDGGLMSYGFDAPDLFRRAAAYVDRILRGATPGELPVQSPTKFELVINLKTARALGLTVPQSLLARADEVIE